MALAHFNLRPQLVLAVNGERVCGMILFIRGMFSIEYEVRGCENAWNSELGTKGCDICRSDHIDLLGFIRMFLAIFGVG